MIASLADDLASLCGATIRYRPVLLREDGSTAPLEDAGWTAAVVESVEASVSGPFRQIEAQLSTAEPVEGQGMIEIVDADGTSFAVFAVADLPVDGRGRLAVSISEPV